MSRKERISEDPGNEAAPDAAEIAESFKDTVAEVADQIDEERALPEDLVRELKLAGVFRLLIPDEFGGGGKQLGDFINALQTFAEADASTAWCISQGAVIATTSLWLPEASARLIWSDPLAAVANGPPRGCVARAAEGHHTVDGYWGFSSGCDHATWMHGGVRVEPGNVWMGVYFPKSEATFHDNWQVAGLRGTRSLEFSVEDLRVDDEWMVDFRKPSLTRDTLYRIPTPLVFAVCFASVGLGVARAGLDVTLDLAQNKVAGYAPSTVRDDPDMQKLIGEAEIRWRAARAFLHDTVCRVIEALDDQDQITNAQRIDLRMAGTQTIREAAAVLDLAYTVSGSSAIYQTNPLQRRFQDMHVITQHVQARMGHYGFVGRYFLGHPFQPGPMN